MQPLPTGSVPFCRRILRVVVVLIWGGATLVGSIAGAGATAETDPLVHQEFAGVTQIGGTTQVCLVDTRSRQSYWLNLGGAGPGLVAEHYDPDREAVFIRTGEHARWLTLRRSAVVPVPVVYREDRSIDFDHMALTERQKEMKAALQHWELMEISRLGRIDAPAAKPPAASSAANTSQQR